MKLLYKRLLISLAALSVVIFVGPMQIFGQQTRSELTISPPLFELSANPGDRLKHTIRLTNSSDGQQDISVDVRNFTALNEQGSARLTEEDTPYSLSKWVKVSPSSSKIASGASRNFTFTINVPLNAEPGGHFGSVVFRTANLGRLESAGGAALQQEIAALVLVKVAGDLDEQLTISSFRPDSLVFLQDNSLTLNVRLSNQGNVHIKPRGIITIKNMFGSEKAVINLDEQNVLPDSSRVIPNDWKPEGLAFGYYSADLNLVYGSDNTLLSSSVGFWVLPLNFLIPILAVLAAAIYIGTRYRQRIVLAAKILLRSDGTSKKRRKKAGGRSKVSGKRR